MKIERMNKGNWGKIRAFFDLQTDDGFTLKGFKLVEGINGLFVGFPSQKGSDDEYYDTIWADKPLKDQVNQLAIKTYGQDTVLRIPKRNIDDWKFIKSVGSAVMKLQFESEKMTIKDRDSFIIKELYNMEKKEAFWQITVSSRNGSRIGISRWSYHGSAWHFDTRFWGLDKSCSKKTNFVSVTHISVITMWKQQVI